MNREQRVVQMLRTAGKDYPTLTDLIATGEFGDMTPQGIYLRMSRLPQGERPEDWGAFNAGGRITWAGPERAAAFLDHHLTFWDAYVGPRRSGVKSAEATAQK